MAVSVKGQKELEKYIKKMSDPEKVFDDDVKKIAKRSLRSYKKTTPKDTGNTSTGWLFGKLGKSIYLLSNDVVTKKSKRKRMRYNIVRLLDEGHIIYPTSRRKKGLKYLDKIEKAASNMLARLMLARIART